MKFMKEAAPSFSYDQKSIFIGIDEVGRGPIAGPVTIGIFVVPKKYLAKVHIKLSGIQDSKKLSSQQRNHYKTIVDTLIASKQCWYTTVSVSARIIERNGITKSIRRAMHVGLRRLGLDPHQCHVFLDGGLYISEEWSQETIIKGDQSNWLISTASVIAKVIRDHFMESLHERYPQYGFNQHKGYGTKVHYAAIDKYGMSTYHRSSWIKKQS